MGSEQAFASAQVEAWTKAFVAAQAEFPDIPKSKTAHIPTKSGGSYSYDYADLPAIIEKVRPVLSAHGLAFAQSVEYVDSKVAIATRIYHSGGHVETFGPVVLPGGNDAQSAGSAVTYGRRYALCAALGIAADEDDDGNAAGSKSEGAGASVPPDPEPDAWGSPRSPSSAPASQVQDQGGGAAPAGNPHNANGDGPDASSLAPHHACLRSPGNPNGLSKVDLLKIARGVAEEEGIDPPQKFEDIAALPAGTYDDFLARAKGKVVPA